MSSKPKSNESSHKKPLSSEQRARRLQGILFSLLAAIMILSMIVALVAK
ncbi:MAG: hypothetical protein WBV22_04965 [Anaerolineaceae bacterium]